MALNMYNIIENNTNFVVIYKRPNINFHSEDGEIGLFEQLKQDLANTELYPVHRLDKVTSGLLVMAKTQAVNHALNAAFAEREVEKFYLAISAKKPNKKQGLIKGDMEKSRRGSFKLTLNMTNPAITQFFSTTMESGKRLFLIKPRTGKTHQIRVALKSIAAPIYGDSLYGDANDAAIIDRTYLHAYSLGFSLFGKPYCFTALPEEGEHFTSATFHRALALWENPRELAWPVIVNTQKIIK